jgi:hypothetical protein
MTEPAPTLLIAPTDVQALASRARDEALAFVDAHKVDVTDLDTLTRAVDTRARIGEHVAAIRAKLAGPKSWAHKMHRWICQVEADAVAPFESLDAYEADQIRRFKEARDRARADDERARAEAQRRDDDARAAHEAAALEASGQHALAAAVIEAAITTPPPVVALPDETRGVVSFVRRWKWKYGGGPDDVKATPPSILARTLKLIPREYLCVDEAKVGAYARAMKDSGSIPGIDIYYRDDPVR